MSAQGQQGRSTDVGRTVAIPQKADDPGDFGILVGFPPDRDGGGEARESGSGQMRTHSTLHDGRNRAHLVLSFYPLCLRAMIVDAIARLGQFDTQSGRRDAAFSHARRHGLRALLEWWSIVPAATAARLHRDLIVTLAARHKLWIALDRGHRVTERQCGELFASATAATGRGSAVRIPQPAA